MLGNDDLKELGKRHIKYGVKENDYVHITKAILQTMQLGLQTKNTPEVKEAWIKACTMVSEAMISDNYLKNSTIDEDDEEI